MVSRTDPRVALAERAAADAYGAMAGGVEKLQQAIRQLPPVEARFWREAMLRLFEQATDDPHRLAVGPLDIPPYATATAAQA